MNELPEKKFLRQTEFLDKHLARRSILSTALNPLLLADVVVCAKSRDNDANRAKRLVDLNMARGASRVVAVDSLFCPSLSP
jgi:hypothetical protein